MALPELIAGEPDAAECDVEIALGEVPHALTAASTRELDAELSEREVLLNIPNVGRYHVRNGCNILVEAAPGVEAKDLRLFLLGSALGALYFQRRYFPLHASVVVINDQAVAFTGDTGAGKSTQAAWLNSNGFQLLCDDVCVIRFSDTGEALAYPGFPRLKLWDDALAAFDIETSGLQRDYFRANKYHLAAKEGFGTEAVPLKHINILQYSNDDSPPRIEAVKPADAVHLLRNNTYRYQYISGMGLTQSHFLDCAKLARSTQVNYLTRARRLSSLPECQTLIEQQMQ